MPEVRTERPARSPRSPVAILRGLAAVAALFAGAVDGLVSAFLGMPRLGWLAHRVGEMTAEQYRRGAWDVYADAEVIADPAPAGPDGCQEGDS